VFGLGFFVVLSIFAVYFPPVSFFAKIFYTQSKLKIENAIAHQCSIDIKQECFIFLLILK